jgi:hypothetical protein
MLARHQYILSPPDITDPSFPALCAIWTRQMRSEMQETIALTRKTLAESRALMAEVDRIIARK